MPTVCTARAGRNRSAPSMPSLPSSPRPLDRMVSATSRLASTSSSNRSQAMSGLLPARVRDAMPDSAARRPDRPSRIARRDPRAGSHVEAELHHVAVGDHVVLALHPEPADVAGLGPAAHLEQFVPVDHLGPDEPPLEVGVDHPGALRGSRRRPGTSMPATPSRRW